MNADLKTLVDERAQVKAALTRFNKLFESSNDSTPIDVMEARLEKNIGLLEKFELIQDKIEILVGEDEAEIGKNDEERTRFENLYFNLIVKVRRFIKASQPESINTGNSPVRQIPATPETSESPLAVKLPTISLPNFDGNRNQWVRFKESFESLIHNSESLTHLQKFHYLNASISGPAARVIQSLGISEANYAAAWQALKRRYEDPNALIDHHTKALFNLPSVVKPSHIAIRQLLDDTTNYLAALKALGELTDSWGTLLLQLISSKLDSVTQKEWKKHSQTIAQKKKFEDMANFLEQYSRLLEDSAPDLRLEQPKLIYGNQRNTYKRHPQTTTLVANLEACLLCKGNHRLAECNDFAQLSIFARRAKALKFKVCFNCLNAGHMNKDCTRFSCRTCGKKHHTLVHIDSNDPITNDGSGNNSSPSKTIATKAVDNSATTSQSFVSHFDNSEDSAVLLSTAIVHVLDAERKKHECRVLLDQASQANFISQAFCDKLKLKLKPFNARVSGIGKTASNSIRGRVNVEIASRINLYKSRLTCLILPVISDNIPNFSFRPNKIPIPKKLPLADPHYSESRGIDLLIGGGLFWDIICVGQHRLGRGFPVIQKTQLGWILAGAMNLQLVNARPDILCHVVTNSQLNENLEKFWKLEETHDHSSNHLTLDPKNACEISFRQTTTRNNDGRYIVKIPFNDRLGELGDSRQIAEKRLLSIEKRFARQAGLREAYFEFMAEYERLGHMSEIPSDRIHDGEPSYYLPHHAVFKATSTTTKLRVVFDGSAKSSSGLSLNAVQHVGLTVQDDLFSIVLRFREHRFVISADAAKMYRQILIDPSQRRYQRILFRVNPSEPMKTYELHTVTYGTASASYLATRVLRQIGEDHIDKFPMAGPAIIRDFYVDDLLTGADSIEEARALKDDISSILATAGFQLRKWASNDTRICTSNDANKDTSKSVSIDADNDPKTLGLLWDTEDDCLQYSVLPVSHQRITKRTILSDIARIFDPLGLVGPAVIQAKMMMQELWHMKVSWDESLPLHLHSAWKNFRQVLLSINDLRIPRPIRGIGTANVQHHGFCDASEKAYGAAVYLRSQDAQGTVTCRLLCARSRVAPLKTVSLPRLELCGALLLAKLMTQVRCALRLDINEEHY